MSEHTPGRLVVRGGYSIYTADDKTPVADTCLTNSVPDNDEANARRLVAAWNWCDGLSTQNLEDNVLAKELAHRYNAVIAERDSLRAVNAELKKELEKYDRMMLDLLSDEQPSKDAFRYRHIRDNDCDDFIQSDARGVFLPQGDALDTRVDAAIASARKQGEQG